MKTALTRIILVSSIAIPLAGCSDAIKVKKSGKANECYHFNISQWGEYASSVSLIELRDVTSDEILWAAKPNPNVSEVPIVGWQMCAGINRRELQDYFAVKDLQFFTKSGGESFFLERGREYRIHVDATDYNFPASVTFSFPVK
jgi:hypothetical protein